jgi:hypothetical protein
MRRLVVVSLVALLAAAAVVGTGTASAATKNPCKVLSTKDISKVFGGASVSKGEAGLKTAANAQCTFTVAAGSELPEGDVVVIVMFAGAKPAYDGLKTSDGYVPVPELGKSIYNEQQSVIETLKGDVLLGVMGLFDTGDLPITYLDVESQLVALSKIGLKRV